MDLVSVIIPVYNVEPYLEKCIESVIKQTYKNLEILLIDDGSTDSGGVICDKYARGDCRIKVFHRENEGVSAARNFGIDNAKGQWLFFVDSDDWLDLNAIAHAMKSVNKDDDICFIGYTEIEDEVENTTIDLEDIHVLQIEKSDFCSLQYCIFNRDRVAICDRKLIKLSSSWKFYRKEMIEKNHITFPLNLKNGEDGVFNLYAYRYARHAVALEGILYYYRQRPDSVTKKYTKSIEKEFQDLHQAYF